MKKIAIQDKYTILVDDEDYDKIKNVNLYFIVGKKYIAFTKDKHSVYLHRYLLGVNNSSMYVDHINGNTFDNRKCNLRICSPKDNIRNRHKLPTNTSGFKGVAFDKVNNKWRAQIQVNGKGIKLGRFVDKIEAAKAYDQAAIKYFGEFACTNKDLGLLKE